MTPLSPAIRTVMQPYVFAIYNNHINTASCDITEISTTSMVVSTVDALYTPSDVGAFHSDEALRIFSPLSPLQNRRRQDVWEKNEPTIAPSKKKRKNAAHLRSLLTKPKWRKDIQRIITNMKLVVSSLEYSIILLPNWHVRWFVELRITPCTDPKCDGTIAEQTLMHLIADTDVKLNIFLSCVFLIVTISFFSICAYCCIWLEMRPLWHWCSQKSSIAAVPNRKCPQDWIFVPYAFRRYWYGKSHRNLLQQLSYHIELRRPKTKQVRIHSVSYL